MPINTTDAIKMPQVQQFLKKHFTVPSIDFPQIVAPSLTSNYRVVGQAFDYLMRFYLERNYVCQRRDEWIAETGVSRLLKHRQRDEYDRLYPFVRKARYNYNAYIKDGIVTDALLRSCINLAHLDKLVRIGN